MAKVDVNAGRAGRLYQALQQQKQTGEYPLSADRLRQLTDPSISDPELLKALAHRTVAGQVVVAAKKDVTAPLVLVGDEALLAGSDLLLSFALGKLAAPETPLQPIKKILNKVDSTLRPLFEASLAERVQTKTFPPGVGTREAAKKPHFYLDRFPPPPPPRSPAEQLADSLLARLREQGSPATLLTDLVVGKVSPAALKAALAAEPFLSTAVVVPVSKTLQVVGLERGAVLASDRLLLALLQTHTSPKKPAIRPGALAETLPESDRDTFRAALRARIGENRLPQGVLSQQEENEVALLLQSNLPPAQRLAPELLQRLRSMRENDPGSYPPRLTDLLARVEVEPNGKLAKQVVAEKAFTAGAVVALAGQADSPVALAGDEDRLLHNPNLVHMALEGARSDDTQAVALADLGKKLARELRPGFAALVERQVTDGSLPAGVGCLRIKKKPHLFLLAEVGGARAAPPALADPAPIDFARMFDAAFARLDRERGSHNLVSLVQLRREVPLERHQFDQKLTDLRREGRYSLVGAEGRHGLSEEERGAGITEHGHLLLFVSRREE